MIRLDLRGGVAVFTDRHGGVSAPPFDTLNVGAHVGDDAGAVAQNRARVAAAAGAAEISWLHHVHGTAVLHLDRAVAPGTEADGSVTARPGLAVTAMGADCAPVALANDGAVGACHVGWRGLADGVIAQTVAALRAAGPGEVRAAVGPCICGRCYEFGAGDLARVARSVGPEVVSTTHDGKPALDLPAGIVAALAAVGVARVETVGGCTAESPDLFSYRRDGVTGRQAVAVVRT